MYCNSAVVIVNGCTLCGVPFSSTASRLTYLPHRASANPFFPQPQIRTGSRGSCTRTRGSQIPLPQGPLLDSRELISSSVHSFGHPPGQHVGQFRGPESKASWSPLIQELQLRLSGALGDTGSNLHLSLLFPWLPLTHGRETWGLIVDA